MCIHYWILVVVGKYVLLENIKSINIAFIAIQLKYLGLFKNEMKIEIYDLQGTCNEFLWGCIN